MLWDGTQKWGGDYKIIHSVWSYINININYENNIYFLLLNDVISYVTCGCVCTLLYTWLGSYYSVPRLIQSFFELFT